MADQVEVLSVHGRCPVELDRDQNERARGDFLIE